MCPRMSLYMSLHNSLRILPQMLPWASPNILPHETAHEMHGRALRGALMTVLLLRQCGELVVGEEEIRQGLVLTDNWVELAVLELRRTLST